MGVVYRALQLAAGADRGAEGDRARAARRRGRPRALPRRGTGRRERRPSERHPGARGGRGRRRRVHRDALRRRSGPALARATTAARSIRRRRPASSPRPRRRSTRSTAPASSIATSSPRTCSSTRDGHVYLTDFGLAKQVITHSGATRTGHWVGTLDYVAPEQIRGGRIDARADVYALGGVLHYALTGRVPFEREGDEAKLWAQLSAPPPVPSQLRPGLPARLRRRRGARDGQGRGASATRRRAISAAPRSAAAAGTVPTEPERVVARGAAAPGAAPTEPGLAAEASTRTRARGRGHARRACPPRGARRRAGRGLAAGAVALALVAIGDRAWAPRDEPRTPAATRRPRRPPRPPPRRPRRASRSVAKTIANVSDRPNGIVLARRRPLDLERAPAASHARRRRDRQRAQPAPEGRASTSRRSSPTATTSGSRSPPTREVLRFDGRTGQGAQAPDASRPRPLRLAVDAQRRLGRDRAGDRRPRASCCATTSTARLTQQTLVVNEGIGGLIAADGAIWVIKDRTHKLARLRPGADGARRLGDAARSRPSRCASATAALWVTLDGEDAIARISADGHAMRTAAAGHAPSQSVRRGRPPVRRQPQRQHGARLRPRAR